MDPAHCSLTLHGRGRRDRHIHLRELCRPHFFFEKVQLKIFLNKKISSFQNCKVWLNSYLSFFTVVSSKYYLFHFFDLEKNIIFSNCMPNIMFIIDWRLTIKPCPILLWILKRILFSNIRIRSNFVCELFRKILCLKNSIITAIFSFIMRCSETVHQNHCFI